MFNFSRQINNNKSNSAFNSTDHLPQTNRKIIFFFKLIIILLFLVIIGLLYYIIFADSSSIKQSFFGQVSSLIQSTTIGTKLTGEDSGKVNVLLLGIGGSGHDGGYLADAIIVASLDTKNKTVSMVSIPRDYKADLGNYGIRKINAAFAEGFDKNNSYEDGAKLITKTVEEISGLDIPYYAVIDFRGFEKAIDSIGGITVNIENTFTDYTYPNNSGGYIKPVTFKKGTENMDGSRALIFARSRHAAGPEGSDYARGLRQQKVIEAAKNKLTSLGTITNVSALGKLYNNFKESVHTNIDLGEMYRFYELGGKIQSTEIASSSIDPSTKIVCPDTLEPSGAFVVDICPGYTKTDVKNFFKYSFEYGSIKKESATITIIDLTPNKTALASFKSQLNEYNIENKLGTNKSNKSYVQNVIFANKNKPSTINLLKETFSANQLNILPEEYKAEDFDTDLVLFLSDDKLKVK